MGSQALNQISVVKYNTSVSKLPGFVIIICQQIRYINHKLENDCWSKINNNYLINEGTIYHILCVEDSTNRIKAIKINDVFINDR